VTSVTALTKAEARSLLNAAFASLLDPYEPDIRELFATA
jgi:hypothetical protein